MKINILKINRDTILRLVCWAAVLLYLAAIFNFSAQNGSESNKLSKGIVREVEAHVKLPTEIIKGNKKLNRIDYNEVLRKSAHFLEYFFLAMVFCITLIKCKVNGKAGFTITILFCMLFAASDELHQRFVHGRSPLIKDILIDTAGAMFGTIIIFCLNRKYKFHN